MVDQNLRDAILFDAMKENAKLVFGYAESVKHFMKHGLFGSVEATIVELEKAIAILKNNLKEVEEIANGHAREDANSSTG